MAAEDNKSIVVITGAAGNIGQSIATELRNEHTIVGLDVEGKKADFPLIDVDLSSGQSVNTALEKIRETYGDKIAAVIHLAAYFDFTGEDNPLYTEVNVDGTRNLLRALQNFEVERFIYSGTMLVHEAGKPGEIIDEGKPINPKWAYPQSKADAEAVIKAESGKIPYLLLHLAGLYDDESAVPTLAHQIARIYGRDLKSRLYAGDLKAGQSLLHKNDLVRLFRLAVEKRHMLVPDAVILAGETEAVSYEELQNLIGSLIHGKEEWTTLSMPKPLAKAGAWVEEKAEPIIPDAIDGGEKPFIRPFMVDMADDHYALDISRANDQLGWRPRHSIRDTLPKIVNSLKADPEAWYERHGITLENE
ncbi:NAD(P)-dependent oxidoreductase [Mesorhizobium sp. SB112]|uniref:NAD-dependent epimerase/dehydratase family protein n=1 Tax=Mesorhizobium sp. SB112 TaxID=3151853 RepID=UPI00326773C7